MIELPGRADLWEYHDQDRYVVIPTNGTVRRDGKLVMGRGLAAQAAKRWPKIQGILGDYVKKHGSRVFFVDDDDFHIFSFPVKEHWRDRADLQLIQQSAQDLAALIQDLNARTRFQINEVYLPRVGCGNGRLEWESVRPVLLFALGKTETKFYVVDLD